MIASVVDKEGLVKDEENARCSYLTEKVFSYSSNVLIGNWMESRYRHAVKKNNAILPGMMIDDKCENHQTASQATYTAEAFDLKRAASAHNTLRGEVRAIKLGQGSNVILHDADKFLTNCTTMNNLMFDIWPKMRLEECLKMKLLGKAIYKRSRFNPLESYGNNSLISKKPTKRIAKIMDNGWTSYARDFPRKFAEKRKMIAHREESSKFDQEEAPKDSIIDSQILKDLKNIENPVLN